MPIPTVMTKDYELNEGGVYRTAGDSVGMWLTLMRANPEIAALPVPATYGRPIRRSIDRARRRYLAEAGVTREQLKAQYNVTEEEPA